MYNCTVYKYKYPYSTQVYIFFTNIFCFFFYKDNVCFCHMCALLIPIPYAKFPYFFLNKIILQIKKTKKIEWKEFWEKRIKHNILMNSKRAPLFWFNFSIFNHSIRTDVQMYRCTAIWLLLVLFYSYFVHLFVCKQCYVSSYIRDIQSLITPFRHTDHIIFIWNNIKCSCFQWHRADLLFICSVCKNIHYRSIYARNIQHEYR